MGITRRQLLKAAGSLSLGPTALAATPEASSPPTSLPDKDSFAYMESTYLDSGTRHPLPIRARKNIERYLDYRMLRSGAPDFSLDTAGLLAKYAKLVNAEVDELTFVQSTTTAEQMFIRSLGLPEKGAHVVTDTLHFFGSLPIYKELEKRGVEVTWVRERDGRIPLDEMRRAIRPGTRLVALSLTSTINGFQHDLPAICEIAHDAGALVYADIIHAAGCTPVDLHASRVDMAAGASYKWLMGDFGLGFMYLRRSVQTQLERTSFGYYGLNRFQSHIYPYDPPAEEIVDYAFREDATGLFALGTHSHTVPALLHDTLDYILSIGVHNIQRHATELTALLKEELPRRGFRVITPPESTAPIVTCALENARQILRTRFDNAGVKITLSRNRFRVTPSVFNDQGDIEKLLDVLGRA